MTTPKQRSSELYTNEQVMGWLARQSISIVAQVSSQNSERTQFKHNHKSLRTGKTNVRPKETQLADLFIDFQRVYREEGYSAALKYFIPLKVSLNL